MGVTTDGIPFPELTDSPNGPAQTLALASWLDAWLVQGSAAWTSWTPSVTQGVGVTVTNTRSRYMQFGRLLIAHFRLDVTSSGTSTQGIIVSTPVAAANAEDIGGSIQIFDTSAGGNHIGVIAGATTTTFNGIESVGVMGTGGTAFGLASGDALRGTLIMETAA